MKLIICPELSKVYSNEHSFEIRNSIIINTESTKNFFDTSNNFYKPKLENKVTKVSKVNRIKLHINQTISDIEKRKVQKYIHNLFQKRKLKNNNIKTNNNKEEKNNDYNIFFDEIKEYNSFISNKLINLENKLKIFKFKR